MTKRQSLNKTSPELTSQTCDSLSGFMRDLTLRDSLTRGIGVSRYLLSSNQALLEDLYRKSWLCSKVVDSYAEDMTRGGIKITGLTPQENSQLQKYITTLGIWSSLSDLIKWSRLYGGAVGYLDIDGQDPSTPLNAHTISLGQFRGIKVFDRFRADPDFTSFVEENPEYYRLGFSLGKVHSSRLIKFIGVKLPYNLAQANSFWGDSVLERILDVINRRDKALDNAVRLTGLSLLRTVKIDGLRQILSSGGLAQQNLVKMFDRMKEVQELLGITLLDNSDTFQTDTFTFSGLQELLNSFDQDLAGAADIPMTRLYGQSPSGFSTGDSDLQTYYDKISSQQESMLREPLTKILTISYNSMTGNITQHDVIDFDFVSVWQPNEIADRQQIVNEINTIIAANEKGLISDRISLIELRERGKRYGLFSSITDEDIANISLAAGQAPDLPQSELDEFSLSPDELNGELELEGELESKLD